MLREALLPADHRGTRFPVRDVDIAVDAHLDLETVPLVFVTSTYAASVGFDTDKLGVKAPIPEDGPL